MRLAVLALILLPAIALADDPPVTEKLAQKVGVPLDAYIGGQVFKITRASPLPRRGARSVANALYFGIVPEGRPASEAASRW